MHQGPAPVIWLTPMFQQLKADTLKCDTHYWECQGEKATPSGQARQSAFTTAPVKLGNPPTSSTNLLKPAYSNFGSHIGTDGKLTDMEWEHRCTKGLCYYCALSINLPAPDCCNSQHPKPPPLVVPPSPSWVNLRQLLRR